MAKFLRWILWIICHRISFLFTLLISISPCVGVAYVAKIKRVTQISVSLEMTTYDLIFQFYDRLFWSKDRKVSANNLPWYQPWPYSLRLTKWQMTNVKGCIDVDDNWKLMTLCWWFLDVRDRISIMLTSFGCWRIRLSKPSPTSQSCRKHFFYIFLKLIQNVFHLLFPMNVFNLYISLRLIFVPENGQNEGSMLPKS